MNFLPDTHLLVWATKEPARLSAAAIELLEDPGNGLFFSAVSIWEVAIKQALGRANFLVDAQRLRSLLLENGFRELSMTSRHAVTVLNLPPIHRDPFDRILIAQAMSEGMILLTVDKKIAQYPGPIRKL